MQTTRAFKTGDCQVVGIPNEIAFEDGQELTITRHGDVVMIQPKRQGLRQVLEDLLATPPLPAAEPLERIELPERERH